MRFYFSICKLFNWQTVRSVYLLTLIYSVYYIHQSAITLRPLTGDVNDHLTEMMCLSLETFGTGIHVDTIWQWVKTHDMLRPPKYHSRQSLLPLWYQHSLMAVALPSRAVLPATPEIILRNGQRNVTKSSRDQPGPKTPRFQSNQVFMGRSMEPQSGSDLPLTCHDMSCPVVSGNRAVMVLWVL